LYCRLQPSANVECPSCPRTPYRSISVTSNYPNGTPSACIKGGSYKLPPTESVDFDLDANVAKACKYIALAAEQGCKLIGFSECFIRGYPYFIWKKTVDFESVRKYIDNSLQLDSPQMKLICKTAKQHNIAVNLGFSEHYRRSLYIASAMIGADGEIKHTRRKTKPTHMERTVFGDGSGSSLLNVVDIPGVGKVGGLNCWEHTQPLLRHHTHSQGEEFHVAA
jgi:nitrilase